MGLHLNLKPLSVELVTSADSKVFSEVETTSQSKAPSNGLS
jgi:hypothetical protein